MISRTHNDGMVSRLTTLVITDMGRKGYSFLRLWIMSMVLKYGRWLFLSVNLLSTTIFVANTIILVVTFLEEIRVVVLVSGCSQVTNQTCFHHPSKFE